MPVDSLLRGRAVGEMDRAVRAEVEACVRRALRALGRSRCAVTLVFTDDDEIRELNRRFRNINRATDVLSFQLQELAGETDPAGEAIALGDIVISLETTRRRMWERSLPRALRRLAIHGLCHLFGHDHKKPDEAARMQKLEQRLRRVGQRR